MVGFIWRGFNCRCGFEVSQNDTTSLAFLLRLKSYYLIS